MPETSMLSRPFVYEGRRRTVRFFGPLPAADQRDWERWFHQHGINLTEVAFPGAVAADDQDRFVEFYSASGGTLCSSTKRRVQLEARALPFPNEVQAPAR